MLVTYVAINLHCQCSTVEVAKQETDCGNVHARFDAARGEHLAQVVVGDSRDSPECLPFKTLSWPEDLKSAHILR
jgi:hypothetical protein